MTAARRWLLRRTRPAFMWALMQDRQTPITRTIRAAWRAI